MGQMMLGGRCNTFLGICQKVNLSADSQLWKLHEHAERVIDSQLWKLHEHAERVIDSQLWKLHEHAELL